MSLSAKLTTEVAQVKEQFIQLFEQELVDLETAEILIGQFEHSLLALTRQVDASNELTQYLQTNLSWLSEQVTKFNAEKAIIAEQLIQITRARKGNASYDNHKED